MKIGDIILVNPEDKLLKVGDGPEGVVVSVHPGDFPCRATFKISSTVPIKASEIVKILTREQNPEYFL